MTAIPKPRTFHADLAKLPAALLPLTLQKRWVIWKLERRGDHWTKPPYQAKFYNEPARSDDSSTWGTYADAVLAVVQGHADGIGYMLKGSGLAAIDLDQIRDLLSGRVLPWAEALFAEAVAAGAYVEWTVSGTGARIIGLGAGDKLHKKITVYKQNGCACEFYRDCERYITISGMQISPGDYPGLPVPTTLPKFDLLFDALYTRFTDAKRRPAANECEFAPGLVIGIEPIEPANKLLDFNGAGPQVDHDAVIANGVPQGGRSEAFQSAVWHLASQGKTAEQIAEELAKRPAGIGAKYAGRLLAEVQRSYGKWQSQRQAGMTGAQASIGTSGAAATGPSWPQIQVVAGEIPRVVAEAEAALMAFDVNIYQRAGQMVRPVLTQFRASHKRDDRGWRLKPVTKPYLLNRLACAAQFWKFDVRAKAWRVIDCPGFVAEQFLENEGSWRLPVLAGLVHTPFLREDGSICETPGFDRASGLLYIPDGEVFPPVPPFPTKADAAAALSKLLDTVKTFPFVNDLSRAVWLSAALTIIDRRSMAVAPLHGFSAPKAGMGKTKLVDLCSILATGRLMPVSSLGGNEEETEKRLTGSLLSGATAISLDNCSRELSGDFLNQCVSQSIVNVRLLGKNDKNYDVLNIATLFATGNNLTIAADLTRRVLLSSIDAAVELPEKREFAEDATNIVRRRRGELVVAVLTVLRAWHIASNAERTSVKVEPLGGFEEWQARVAKPLVWLGQADPGLATEEARTTDPEQTELIDVITQWQTNLQVNVRYTVQEVIERAINVPSFYSALMTVAAARSGQVISSERLGRWLKRSQGRVAAGHKLRSPGLSAGKIVWMLEKAPVKV